VLHAAAGDGVGNAALGGKPKDEIANQHGCSWDTRPEHKVAGHRRQIAAMRGDTLEIGG
jgi:hypothetical protein